MSYPRYREYKDSGEPTVGAIPSTWRIARVGDVAHVINGYPFDARLFDDGGIHPLIRIRDLGASETATRYCGEFVESAAVRSSDVLIGMDGDFNVGRWKGTGPALLNQRMCCIRASSSVVVRYLEFVLPGSLRIINDLTYATTVKHLSSSQVEKIRVALPPTDVELIYVVDFLDRETAKIDALVAEQEQLITLLKEKRQAVISNAVTKGLDPSVPMKDSGVEWLGEVPAHWSVTPLRWVASCRSGEGLAATEVEASPDEAHTVPVVGGNGLMGYTDAATVDHQVLAVGRVGALCGNVHVVSPPAWITDNALIVDPDLCVFDIHFLSAVLRIRNLNDIASKTAQPLITGTQVSDQRLPAPPIDEQRAIVEHLSNLTTSYSGLINEAVLSIELLRERRSALISAAVTGQIDVRGLAPAQEQAA